MDRLPTGTEIVCPACKETVYFIAKDIITGQELGRMETYFEPAQDDIPPMQSGDLKCPRCRRVDIILTYPAPISSRGQVHPTGFAIHTKDGWWPAKEA